MSTCEKTGAIAYFPDYDEWARGDMHVVGNVWVFYACQRVPTRMQPAPGNADFSIRLNHASFSRETAPYEVYVLPGHCVLDLRSTP